MQNETLIWLFIENSTVTKEIMDAISKMKSLKKIELNNCNIEPDSFKNIETASSNLAVLNIYNVKTLTGEMMSDLAKSKLSNLGFKSCPDLNDEKLLKLMRMKCLDRLKLINCDISESAEEKLINTFKTVYKKDLVIIDHGQL